MIKLPDGVPDAFFRDGREYHVFPTMVGMSYKDCYKCWVNKVPILRMPKVLDRYCEVAGWSVGWVSDNRLVGIASVNDARSFLSELGVNTDFRIVGDVVR